GIRDAPTVPVAGRSDLLRRNDDRLAGHRLAARAGGHADPSERPPFAPLTYSDDQERVLYDDAGRFGEAHGESHIRGAAGPDLDIELDRGGAELRMRVLGALQPNRPITLVPNSPAHRPAPVGALGRERIDAKSRSRANSPTSARVIPGRHRRRTRKRRRRRRRR